MDETAVVTVPVAVFPHDFASVRVGWGTEPNVAYADGRTDDTAVVEAAINRASEAQGTVYFPPGVYRLGLVSED